MPATDGDCCFITQTFYHAISIKHCTPEVAVERGVSATMRDLQILPPLPYDYRHVYVQALGKNVEFAKNRWLFGAQGPSITANSDGLENKRWPSAKTEFFTIYKESRRAPPLVYGQKLLVLPHNL
jgi:hypothetical protein